MGDVNPVAAIAQKIRNNQMPAATTADSKKQPAAGITDRRSSDYVLEILCKNGNEMSFEEMLDLVLDTFPIFNLPVSNCSYEKRQLYRPVRQTGWATEAGAGMNEGWYT